MRKNMSYVVIVSILFLAGCSLSSAAGSNIAGPKTPQALQPSAVAIALFQLIKPDGSTVGITIDDLKALPLKQVSAEGKVEEGPGLLGGLAHATKPLGQLTVNLITGWPFGSFRYGVAYPFASHFLFGMVGASLGVLIIMGVQRYSKK